MSDRIEKVAEIKVVADNTGEIEKLTNQINSLKADLDKLNSKYDSSSSSVKKFDEANVKSRKGVLENGGAMGLLSAATGGLAMDFKDAVEAIELTGVSLKGLRGAIIATGIGALAIVVLELVTNWDKWRGVIMQTTPELEALNNIQGDLTSKLKETYTELYTVKSAFDQAKDGAISKKEALRIYNETLGDTLGKAKSLEEAEDIYNRKTDAYIQATELRMTAQLLLGKAAEQAARLATGETVDLTFWDKVKVGVSGYFFGASGAAKKTAELIGSNTKEAENSKNKLIKLAQQYQKKADDISKEGGLNFQKVEEKKTATAKNSAKERENQLKTLENFENKMLTDIANLNAKSEADKLKILKDGEQKQLDAIKLSDAEKVKAQELLNEKYRLLAIKNEEDRAKAAKAVIDKYQREVDEMRDKTGKVALANQQADELKVLQDLYDKKLLTAEEFEKAKILLADKYAILKKENDDKNAKEEADNTKADNDKKIAEEQAVADAKLTINNMALDATIQGIGVLKMAFEKNKGLQKALIIAESAAGIAKMIINTKAANTATELKYALLPGGSALAKAENTIRNISTGIGIAANVAATAKALKALGGGSAEKGSVGSEGGGGSAPQANFNIVGQSDTNILAQTIANRQQQPIEAFVVGASVTRQQELDDNKIKNSTFL